MSQRLKRVGVLLLGGLFVVGVSFAVASNLGGGQASAASTCMVTTTTSGGTTTYAATVVLSGTDTLALNANNGLLLNGTICSGAAYTPPVLSTKYPTLTSIAVSNAASTTPTLTLDESAATFPCTAGFISGTIGSDAVTVKGPAGTSLYAGGAGMDIGACGKDNTSTLTTGPVDLVGGAPSTTSVLTLSAGGEGGPTAKAPLDGTPSTLAVTLDASASTSTSGPSPTVPPVAPVDDLIAGNGNDTFIAGSAPAALDFSNVTTSSCTSSAVCQLTVNGTTTAASGAGSSMVPAGTAELQNAAGTTAYYTDLLQGVATSYATLTGANNATTTYAADPGGSYTLASSNTSFVGSPGIFGVTIPSTTTSSTVTAGSGTESFNVTANNTTFTGGSGTDNDTFNVSGTTGQNTFVVGSGTNTIYDSGPSNTVDFSGTGPSSNAPLTINASGAFQTNSSGTSLANGQASIGSSIITTFLNGANSNQVTDFTSFNGASNGNTAFLAGVTAGVSFTGGGQTNTVSFDSNTAGVVTNLSGGLVNFSGTLGSSATDAVPSFEVGSGQILVTPPQTISSTNPPTSCTSGEPVCDSIQGVSTVLVPTTTGYSTFYAGTSAVATYTFSAGGNHNRFIGSSGTDNFTGSGDNNDFVAGSGSATFTETTTDVGANNTVDFSNVPVGTGTGCTSTPCSLKINVSTPSSTTSTTTSYLATLSGANSSAIANYTFGGNNAGSAFTNLIGASGGLTTFEGGSAASYDYTGQGSGNSLDFSLVATTGTHSLTYDVATTLASPNPTVVIDNQSETFSGITNLVGLSGGNTSFVGGNTGGYTFNGRGAGNTADFSTQSPSTTLSVTVVSAASSDGITLAPAVAGGTVAFEIPGGTVLCSAAPVVSSGTAGKGTASCNTQANLPTGTQVLAVYTGPGGSPLNGTGAAVVTPTSPSSVVDGTPTTVTGPTVTGSSTNGGGVYQGQAATLSATISETGATVTDGSVTFSVAGGTQLCTAAVSAGSATCSVPAFSAVGLVGVVATYTPSTTSGLLGSAQVASITSSTPTQTGVTVSNSGCVNDYFDRSNSTFIGEASVCTVTATVAEPGSTTVPTGAVNFNLLGAPGSSAPAPLSCSNYEAELYYYPNTYNSSTDSSVGGSAQTVTCSFVATSSNFTVQATYQPVSGAYGASTGTSTLTDGGSANFGVSSYLPTTTGLGTTTSTVEPGSPVVLTATVKTNTATNVPTGSITFATADGTVLSTVRVPTSSPTAVVTYAGSLPRSGYSDVIAYYTPLTNGQYYGSAGILSQGTGNAIHVAIPASSSITPPGSPISVSNNTHNGTLLNLSNSTRTINLSTTTGVTQNVSVGPGEVLVAAPPSFPATCTAASQQPFCDALTNINTVAGSSKGSNTFVAGSSSEVFEDNGPLSTDTGAGGKDTIDFSAVTATSGAQLVVNATAGTILNPTSGGTQTVAPYTATFGSGTTYSFTPGVNSAGAAFFANFIGSGSGYTSYAANATPGESFTASGSNNAIDFSAVTAGLTADLTPAATTTCLLPGTVTFSGGGTDSLCGLTTVTGSASGGNTFKASPTASDTFTAAGNTNTFVGGGVSDIFNATGQNNTYTAGTGGYTINATPSTGNTLDFHLLTSGGIVNASSGQILSVNGDTASFGGASYIFTSLGASPKTFVGSPGGTTFYAGTVSDTFSGTGAATGNTLSYANSTASPLVITTYAPSMAVIGTVNQPFSDIDVFYGLGAGNTTFRSDGTGGYSFFGSGTRNTADYTTASAGITADLTSIPATVTGSGTTQDMLTGVTSITGSAQGGNTFKASNASETFTDPGMKGGDTVNFGGVSTSSLAPLSVNVSGSPVTTAGGASLPDQTAVAGSNQYTLASPALLHAFITLSGSNNGNTTFYAGSSPAYTLVGVGGGNSVSFAGDNTDPIAVTLLNPTDTTTTNNVSICNPSTSGTCSSGIVGKDTVRNIQSIAGPAVGGSSFASAPSSTSTSAFTANGDSNTFTGGAGTNTFTATGNSESFVVGTGPTAITDPGLSNTIDFSNASASGLIVNVSGGQVGQVANNSALGLSTTTFSAVPTIFVGATSGGTTFYAGTLGDTFTGQGTSGNTLSFADATSSGSLAFCLATGTGCASAGQAVLGSVKEPFSSIQAFTGLTGGNTTFVADGTSGRSFTGTGSGNVADFSAVTSPIKADLSLGTVSLGSTTATDAISGIPVVYGSRAGGNTFVAGPSSSGTTAETFGDRNAAATGDSLDLANVATSSGSPLTVNASTTASNGASAATAAGGGNTYSFTAGTFTGFYGANTGYTRFVAPRSTAGYTFCATAAYSGTGLSPSCGPATASNDTVDFTANLSGISADLTTGKVTYTNVTGADTIGTSTTSNNGITAIIGSPVGADAYESADTGIAISDTASTNSLAYDKSPAALRFDFTKDAVTGGPGTDTFSFPGTPTIDGSPKADTFVAGTTAATIGGGAGGLANADEIDLPAAGSNGDTVTLGTGVGASAIEGTVTGSSIGTLTFASDTAPCSTASALCLGTVKGFGTGAGADALSLANVSGTAGAATVKMPATGSLTATGTATIPGYPTISFSGVPTITGTGSGADTLDLSAIGSAGVTVNVGGSGVAATGTATSSALGSVTDTFTGFTTFLGTSGVDTFNQTSDGSFNFDGEAGGNVLNLSGLSSTVNVTLSAPTAECASTTTNNGTASGGNVNDKFECMAQVITSGTQVFTPSSGQPATLNGGGNGTLYLANDPGPNGLTVTLPNGTAKGTVTGDGYNVTFTGMSTVDGSRYNDTFIPGTGNVTINGMGGTDGITYRTATAAAVVNLSSASYTIPTGATGAGTTVPADTATGGFGGTITMQGIANALGTTRYNDILVGGPGQGTLIGGSGNTRFVPTGGNDFIDGGTGSGTTLDLSSLSGKTTLNLALGTPQQTGAGLLTVQPGTIHNLVASNAGSQLQAGNGTVNLIGGPGNDYLAGGTGTQTITGGGGTDTLVAGSGTQTLTGGSAPVTFVPGSGNDTLTSPTTGNTLSYATAPNGAQVNLSANLYSVPAGEPFAGTTLPGNQATGGNGATVNLSGAGITNVVGSPQADVVVTGSSGSTVTGTGGNDLVVINGGNNTFTSGSGPSGATTYLFETTGNNVINGGGNSTVDFSQAPAGVTVNLQSGVATGGFGGTQSLTGVLNAVGTNFNDTLIAGAPGGTITGLGSTVGDFLESGPSGGDTLISGGNGADTFCAEATCAQSGTTAGGGDTMTGGGGNDTFYAQNGAVDTVNGEGGFNQGYFDANDNVTNVQRTL